MPCGEELNKLLSQQYESTAAWNTFSEDELNGLSWQERHRLEDERLEKAEADSLGISLEDIETDVEVQRIITLFEWSQEVDSR